MSEPEFIMLDKFGRPMPSTKMTQHMKESLKEFLDKNKSKVTEFWNRKGWGLRPPVFYDTDNRKWFWDEKAGE